MSVNVTRRSHGKVSEGSFFDDEYTEKILTATVTATGTIASLSYSNLKPNEWYMLQGQVSFQLTANSDTVLIRFTTGGVITGEIGIDDNVDSTGIRGDRKPVAVVFQAKGTDLTTVAAVIESSALLLGAQGKQDTYLQLRSVKKMKFTTEFQE